MLGGQFSDQSEMLLRHTVDGHDERLGTVLRCCLKGARQVLVTSHVEKLRLDAERFRHLPHLPPLRWESRIAHVEEARDPCQSRPQLPQKINPFRDYFHVITAEPGDIRARVVEAGNETSSYRIAAGGHN